MDKHVFKAENVQWLLFNGHYSGNKLTLQLNRDGKPSFPSVYHSPVGTHSETSKANISTRLWNLGTSYTSNTLWCSLSKEESGLGSNFHLKFVWLYIFGNLLRSSISLMKQEYPNLFHSLQKRWGGALLSVSASHDSRGHHAPPSLYRFVCYF